MLLSCCYLMLHSGAGQSHQPARKCCFSLIQISSLMWHSVQGNRPSKGRGSCRLHACAAVKTWRPSYGPRLFSGITKDMEWFFT